MVGLLVEPAEIRMARRAGGHRLEFGFLQMAVTARHRHHRRGRVDLVAGNTVQRRPVACPVAEVAQDSGVLSLQGPRVPGHAARGRGGPQRKKRSALGDGMTNRTRARKDLSQFHVPVTVIVTSEATRPITVAYIAWIGSPIDVHR